MRKVDSQDSRTDNSNCVYVIRAIGTDYYKIGYTQNVKQRLSTLRTGVPFDLDIIALYFTTQYEWLEKKLHERFDEKRRKNTEWFQLSESDVEFFCNKSPEEMLHQFPSPRGSMEHTIMKESLKTTSIERPKIEADKSREYHEFYDGLVPQVLGLYKELRTWQAVADHYGISKEMAWNIGVHKTEPCIDPEIRKKLGLSGLTQALIEMPEDIE